MGQAKKRGTREQRIAESLGLRQRPLTDIKKEHGLPDSAEFLGYGVHLPEPDEFLTKFDDDGYMTKKLWAKDPQLAIHYKGFADAYDVSRKCAGSIVVGMFDFGDQIYVAQVGG
jgi:hypothetical protein